MRYFFFGSLRDPDVLAAVLGRRLPPSRLRSAWLKGHRLVRARGETYPLLVPARAGAVLGALVHGLTAADAQRLAFFEGEEYETHPVMVRLGPHRLARAFAFRALPALASDGRAWSFETWRRHHKRPFLSLARLWMEVYRDRDLAYAEALWRERRRHGLTAALRRGRRP